MYGASQLQHAIQSTRFHVEKSNMAVSLEWETHPLACFAFNVASADGESNSKPSAPWQRRSVGGGNMKTNETIEPRKVTSPIERRV
jgi:hypothetical protein